MTEFDGIDQLRAQLARALTLPISSGVSDKYAPQLSYGRHAGPPLPDTRLGAVLVLLYPVANDWHVLLTVRTSHLAAHAGQMSFPGGRIEPGESPEQAALREFAEELGVAAEFEIVGRLPEVFVFASNFLVTPVVALAKERPAFVPNPAEVAEVVEVSLVQLAEPDRRGSHEIERGPLRFIAPHFMIGERPVWGATWIMLGELLERLAAVSLSVYGRASVSLASSTF